MIATQLRGIAALPTSAPATADDAGISVTVWIDPRPVQLSDALTATGFDVGSVGLFAVVALVTGTIAIAISHVRKGRPGIARFDQRSSSEVRSA